VKFEIENNCQLVLLPEIFTRLQQMSNVLKDGKIEAVHDLLEQQQALYLLAI